MTLLQAQSLTVARGDRVLLSQLSFSLGRGDVVHLRGRNGLGKSSLIEVLVGLRAPQSGTVQRVEASRIHWVGHRNALHPDLTVEENLRDWCALNAATGVDLQPALERIGLWKLRRRPARTLSMGQKRRAALSRLLLQPRALWILDEPLSGLDTDGAALLGELLNAHVAADGGALVTSHQPLPGRLPQVTFLEPA